MGAVYLARQISQNRQVALKILPQEMARDEEFLERFRREARAAAKLVHPNIVAAYDVGVADNFHYIAMEYVDGKDLESILNKKGIYETKELLKIAHDICSALEAAESKSIVHRDIKPSNILLNSQGQAKLIDMGLSSAGQGDRRVTMAGFAVGTPYYISPEQARGVYDVDGRSDIYSLGATLYHLCSGKLPFPGTNPVVIMTQHITEQPKAPHEKEPKVDRHLSDLIMKMMAKDPADRQQTASELKVDIEKCMLGESPGTKASGVKKSKAPGQPSKSKIAVPAAPKVSFGEQISGAIDSLFFFLPKMYRLAAAAVIGTLLLLIFILLIVAIIVK